MKHIGLYILLVCTVFAGCSDKYSSDFGLKPTLTPRYLRVSPTSLSFSANQASSQSVGIETMETPWKVDNAIEWVTISAANGQSNSNINVSATENKDANAARTGIFYIKRMSAIGIMKRVFLCRKLLQRLILMCLNQTLH